MKVTVWSTPNCVQCAQTKKQFDRLGIRYDEMALDQHPDKLEEFKAKGLLQAPIVTTDTKVWSGFRIDKIQSLAAHLKSLGETPVETAPGEHTREFYRKQGEQRAIDRIVNSLVKMDAEQNKPCEHSPKGYDKPCGSCVSYFSYRQIIDLIKGNK